MAQKPTSPPHFKNGFLDKNKNLLQKKIQGSALLRSRFNQKYFLIIQFENLPDLNARQELASHGIKLFDYLPANAFLAELSDSSQIKDLKSLHVTGAYSLPTNLKIENRILQNASQSQSDVNAIAVNFFGSIDRSQVVETLQHLGARMVKTKIQPHQTIFINGSTDVLQKIAALPFVSFVATQSLLDVPLNNNNRGIHAVDALSASTGRNLWGKGVVLGIGDNADPSSHIDFTGRLIQRNPTTLSAHGTHTAGTMAGGGILNPRYKGMAPKATILPQYFSDIIANTALYCSDNNMVLTNNSYYTGADFCPGDGQYDALSSYADYQLDSITFLLHVFAAGNDGSRTCSPYPLSFATIKSGFQCAKNILTVGAMSNVTYSNWVNTSKGPVSDGRLKPEIVTSGQGITSTIPFNNYGSMSGTSMAAPTATGILALLYERYRQLHGGSNPPGALIKSIVCNSADDLGNTGPDFTYGFGMLNARTSVETMEKNQYFSGSVSNSATNTHTISGIPAGTRQLKVMLYWPDAPAAPFAPTSLVNNLDLTVTAPDATIHRPLILDPSPTAFNNLAVEGTDNTNNIEQVVINNPPAGNFTISVTGASVPSISQNYFVAYEIIDPAITVEYPFGSETLNPGNVENIRWSAYDNSNNSFTIEYSTDNGSTWTLIDNNVGAANRSFAWTVPAVVTNAALIRVTRNGGGASDVSDQNFIILGQPTITVSNPCPGYAQIDWPAIPSATQYEIMLLKGDSMQTVTTTSSTSFILPGLSNDSSYYISVRAINNTYAGLRSSAQFIIPNSGACTSAYFDNDFTCDSLIMPVNGRQFTSSQLGTNQIKVQISNKGNVISSGTFNVSYQVNGGPTVIETSSDIIPAHGGENYTFSLANSYDFSAPGIYDIKVWVDYPGDPRSVNDTLHAIVKNLRNDPLVLNSTFFEGFESATQQTLVTNTLGFEGLDRFDFSTNNSNGRARTFVNTGFARTGNRCTTLDQKQNLGTFSVDSLVGTFNLSNYSSTDHIWLNFYYKNHGIDFATTENKAWIRGNDQAAWIPVDTFSIDPFEFDIYQPSKNIDISGILSSAVPAQTISSSFQIKFTEQGKTSANSVVPDGNLDDGYSFDDIVLTKSDNDVATLSLLQPNVSAICGLSNAETVTVQVKNYMSVTLTNVPVTYAINSDTVTELVPSLLPNETVNYSFSQKADLSPYQHYTIRAWVNNPGDTYHKNDTLQSIDFQTTPVISSFPYLEGFENTNGYWYTQGINDDWTWGTPAKQIIKNAANGSKAWVTNLSGNYSNNQLSYLYSPCFDLTSLNKPVFSFSHIFQTEDNCDCDYHWVEYSTNDSLWIKLGNTTSGTNWYDNAARQRWQLSDTLWHVSSIDIPVKAPKVRFRIVMSSDPASNYEGVGVDDIHVFDKAPIYDSTNISNGISQNINGNSWIHFDVAGKRIASINPNGQDLGNTTLKLFIDKYAVRDTTNQYYLERNIVIQPTQPPTASVSIRLYFLDNEAMDLINAVGCTSCTSIHDAYQAGVTQYSSSTLAEEDSTLRNNLSGEYRFFVPQKDVHVIPYDNGYYAEFSVSKFSEFWINGGGPNQLLPIAAFLQSFTATRVDSSALLQWTTASEKNIKEFVVQKRVDGTEFADIGTISSIGNTDTPRNYQYTDRNLQNGNNYYRLRIVYSDGHYIYSPVRVILFDVDGFIVSIFPNPVRDNLFINTSVNCTQIELFDAPGKRLQSLNVSGFQNILPMRNLAKGVYFVIIRTEMGKRIQKVVVN